MNLPELNAVLAAHMVNGVLTIGPGDLGSPDVDRLLAANFPQGKLVLLGAKPLLPAPAQIQVRGSTTLYGVADVATVATFSIGGDGLPALVLVCTPGTYGFGQSFPAFGRGSLKAVTFGNARFTLASTTGVAFSGDYAFPPALQAIAGLLKAPAAVTLSGPLAWAGALPQLALTSGIFRGVALGNITVDVQLCFGSEVEPPEKPDDRPRVRPAFRLQSSLTIAAAGGVKNVAITAPLSPAGRGLMSFSATTSGVTLTDLAGLATIVGGSDLSFPANVPIASQVELTALEIVIAPATATIATLSLQVRSAAPWTIIPGEFAVDEVWVDFVIQRPFGSGRTVFTSIGGQLAVHQSVHLALSYAQPAQMLTARLASGDAVPLSPLLAGFLPGAGLPALNMVRLEFGLDLATKDFQFEIGIMEDWSLDAGGSTALRLTDLLLFLNRSNGQVAGRVFCGFSVAGAALQLFADWQSGQGWIFGGGTLGKQNIPLTRLLGDALALFNLSLPATAPQVTLTGLQLTLASQSRDFGFACDGTVEIMGRTVTMGVALGRTHTLQSGVPVVSITFAGHLIIGGQAFTADFNTGIAGKALKFTWSNTGGPLGFEAVASFFGYSLPALPENLDLGLEDAELYYDFNLRTLVASAHSVNYGRILFASFVAPAASPVAGQRIHLFALEVPLAVQLSDLPVVGDKLPAGLQLGVKDLQIVVASSALAPVDVAALNLLITGTLGGTPLVPASLAAGLTFATTLQMGGGSQPVVVPLTGGGTPAPRSAPPDGRLTTAPAYQAGATWFNVEKSFGPVQFQRIGLQYQNNTLFFLLDASLSFSALSLACEGLGIGSPLTSFSPRPHLDGLAVSFSSGPVDISGGLLVVPVNQLPAGVDFEYLGAVTIAIQPWMITGVASYARVKGAPSFFLFAQVTGALGGPPPFFITGFMGGFGYNSRLALPEPDQVGAFPFVAGLDNPALFGASPTPMSVLAVLAGEGGQPAVVTPAAGANWIAAGILFRSFELVLGRALLVVEFGQDFQVALLGRASASLPQGATTNAYAFVDLQLKASFKPGDGYFGLQASLTSSSFVITQACHLTGGFAFCLWFGPSTHAGDFVVTVGGYHPAFVKPDWYPSVPAVGFNWQPGGDVTIKGGAYFALTPSAIMAGGSLEVLFHSGCINAWFTAYANILIAWKPFHLEADIGISVGASVRVDLAFTTVTLSFELGATLELWGPPTGGIVHVHLSIVSFSVPFGSDAAGARPAPLGWGEFATLLPQPNAGPAPQRALVAAGAAAGPALVLGVQVNRGLTRQDAAGTWFVRADELQFSTTTAVPPTGITFSGPGAPPLAAGARALTLPPTVSIRPMAVAEATSVHSITLMSVDEKKPVDLTAWTQVPQSGNLPEALWGAPLKSAAGSYPTPAAGSATLRGLPTGVQLIAPAATVGGSPGAMDLTALVDPLGGGYEPLIPARQADPLAAPVADPAVIATIAATLGSPAAQTAQQGLLAALAAVQAAPPTSALLSQLAAQAGQTFAQPPLRAT